MSQGFNQLNIFNKNLPAKIPGVSYSEIPEPLTRKPFNIGDSKQIAYKLPNGTYTSNPELANIAKQQMARANRKALLRAAGKGAGIVPTAVEFYKNIAFPVANDLYQGFIMGNPDKSKTLQVALKLAGIDRNGNRITGKSNNISASSINNTSVPFEILDDYQLTGGKSIQVNKKGGVTGGQPTTQAQALALAQQLGGNTPTANQQGADTQQANVNAINDYVSKLQEINQPYLDALKGYLDNYNNLYNQNQLASRRLRDISAITGDPIWYQSSKDYNPMLAEANKVELQKKIQETQAGDLNAINEIMGNLAVAQEMGSSPEAAFANKNLLTAMAMRDRNLTNREIAQLNNAAKLQIALQNAQNRLAVQNLRNQGGMTNALIFAGQYGQPAPGLNQQGAPSNVPASYDVMLQSAHNKNNR